MTSDAIRLIRLARLPVTLNHRYRNTRTRTTTTTATDAARSMVTKSTATATATTEVPQTSPQSAYKALTTAPQTHIYIDVRTPREYQAGHAPMAINVPVTDNSKTPLPDFATLLRNALSSATATATEGGQAAHGDANVGLIVGCKSGRRSMLAIGLLRKAGYDGDLQNLEGGFDNWQADTTLPVEH